MRSHVYTIIRLWVETHTHTHTHMLTLQTRNYIYGHTTDRPALSTMNTRWSVAATRVVNSVVSFGVYCLLLFISDAFRFEGLPKILAATLTRVNTSEWKRQKTESNNINNITEPLRMSVCIHICEYVHMYVICVCMPSMFFALFPLNVGFHFVIVYGMGEEWVCVCVPTAESCETKALSSVDSLNMALALATAFPCSFALHLWRFHTKVCVGLHVASSPILLCGLHASLNFLIA